MHHILAKKLKKYNILYKIGREGMVKKILKSYDWSLLIVYLALAIFGVIMVYSASMVTAIQVYNFESSSYFFERQLSHLIFSFVVFLLAALVPYHILKWNKILVPLVFGIILLLAGLFFIGHSANNATSWFNFGSRNFQPSELAKVVVIIYLAAVYSKKQRYINNFNTGVIPPILILIVICTLTILQPDIGTAFIIFCTGAIVILCSGMNGKTLLRLVLVGMLAMAVLSPFIYLNKEKVFTENRLGRLYSYVDPFEYAQAEGHQLVNSYLAIGHGGLKGVGLGKSVQKLGYLPEAHTDFIMAIIAEELGAIGVLFVIGGLGYLVLKGFYIGMRCRDPFGSLLAFGISGMIGIQTFINLGGVCGLIPITGVTLPFISYGGSSLLFLSGSLGILMNVAMFTNYDRKYKNPDKKPEVLPL